MCERIADQFHRAFQTGGSVTKGCQGHCHHGGAAGRHRVPDMVCCPYRGGGVMTEASSMHCFRLFDGKRNADGKGFSKIIMVDCTYSQADKIETRLRKDIADGLFGKCCPIAGIYDAYANVSAWLDKMNIRHYSPDDTVDIDITGCHR